MTDKTLPLTRAGPGKASTLTSRDLGQPGLHSTVRSTGEKLVQGNPSLKTQAKEKENDVRYEKHR